MKPGIVVEEKPQDDVSRREPVELRWNSGDWKYVGFNTEPPCAGPWQPAWSQTPYAIHDTYLDDDAEEVPERFLDVACRTEDFKALVADHDETIEDSWARLLRIRNRRR